MNKGFTLIELLVTVTLIGIISSMGLAVINPGAQLKKSRDAKRKADLAQLQAVLELYRSDQGSYPDLGSLPACANPFVFGGTTYIKSVPCDPKNTGEYVYKYAPTGSPPSSYTLVACLENNNDSQKDTSNKPAYCAGSSSSWSYSVTNP